MTTNVTDLEFRDFKTPCGFCGERPATRSVGYGPNNDEGYKTPACGPCHERLTIDDDPRPAA